MNVHVLFRLIVIWCHKLLFEMLKCLFKYFNSCQTCKWPVSNKKIYTYMYSYVVQLDLFYSPNKYDVGFSGQNISRRNFLRNFRLGDLKWIFDINGINIHHVFFFHFSFAFCCCQFKHKYFKFFPQRLYT